MFDMMVLVLLYVAMLLVVSHRTFKKTKRCEDSGENTKSKSTITFSKLTEKLEKSLAEEIENCWIDPKKVTLDKFFGHGENDFQNMKMKARPHLYLYTMNCAF